jgi:outer membrane protein assembly factor BamB
MNKRAIVRKAIDLPDGSGKLIVLDWSAEGPKRRNNLVRIDTEGDEIWKAELPRGTCPDFFTDVRADGTTITANTWSCFMVTLDRETGTILSAQFTK